MVCQVQQIVAVTNDLAQFSWTDLSANFRDGGRGFQPQFTGNYKQVVRLIGSLSLDFALRHSRGKLGFSEFYGG